MCAIALSFVAAKANMFVSQRTHARFSVRSNIDVTTGTVTAADITEKEGGGPVHFNMSYARNGTVCSGSERTKETRLNG